MKRRPNLGSLLLCAALAACAANPPVVKAPPPPAPAPAGPVRSLVEAPPPADVPDTPVPALKPGTELPESDVPAGGTSTQETASPWGTTADPEAPAVTAANPLPPNQTADTGQPAAGQSPAGGTPAASLPNSPENDPRRFQGISDSEASRLLGPPAEKRDTPPSRVWTYRSTSCNFTLFFYPEVGGNGYRALTYQFGNADMTEADKRACVASLLKVHAG